MLCSIPIPCSQTISPRSSITRRTRSAGTTPLQEERTDVFLQVGAKHHRETVSPDLLLGHARTEHEACRQAPAEIAPPGAQQDAGGIVGRLLAPQQLDLLVAPDVFEPRAEEGFRIAAPIGDLLQQVPLLGALLRCGHRGGAVALRISVLVALRPEVTQRAGHLPVTPARDIGEVRRCEAAFR